jgi:hypothetical protein
MCLTLSLSSSITTNTMGQVSSGDKATGDIGRELGKKLLPESWSPGLNANWQIMRTVFLRKRKYVLLFVRRRGQRQSTSQSTVLPLLRENVHFLKESSGAQADCVTKHMSRWPLDWAVQESGHHISKAVPLGWQVYFSGGQREIRGRRLPGLIEE